MTSFSVNRMTRQAAHSVARWRYEPPHDYYNLQEDPVALAAFFTDPENAYFQLRDAVGELVAFCCFGYEAQVPGGDYRAPALDFGIGVRPNLTGQGQGLRYLEAVLDFGIAHFGPQPLRLTVASFNQRAINLYLRAGFGETARFTSSFSDRSFFVMMRDGLTAPRT